MQRLLALGGAAIALGTPGAHAAVRAETAAPKKVQLKLHIPKTGSVTLAQATIRGATREPTLSVPGKASLPPNVEIVGGLAKEGKNWVERIAILNHAAASKTVKEDFGFAAVQTTIPGVANRGVTGASEVVGLLPGAVPAPSSVFCSGPDVNAGVLAGPPFGDYDAGDILDFAREAQCGNERKGFLAFFGLADGTFGFGSAVPLASPPTSVAAMDIDLDGLTDLVVSESTGVDVVPGAAGGLGGPVAFPAFAGAVSVAAADVTGDGKPELIVAGGTRLLILGPSARGPRLIDSETLNAPFVNMATGNIGADADVDVVVATTAGLEIFEGAANGVDRTQTLPVTGGPPIDVAVGRINTDAFDDVMIMQQSGTSSLFQFFSLPGNGTSFVMGGSHGSMSADPSHYRPGFDVFAMAGAAPVVRLVAFASGGDRVFTPVFPSFGPEQFLTAGTTPVGVVVVDVNRDGTSDVLTLNRGSGTITTNLGNAAASPAFAPPRSSPVGANPVSMSLFNFNNDGVPDVVVASDTGVGMFTGNPDGTFQRP